MRRFGVLLVLVSMVALGACSASGGGSDGASTTKPSATPTTTEPGASTSTTASSGPSRAAYSVAFSDSFYVIDHDDRCLSGRMVDLVGLDELHQADITPEEFAGEAPILERLGIDRVERAQLEADITEALEACSNAERIATDYLTDDNPKYDFTRLAPCVAEPLRPLLATIIVKWWAGESSGDVVDDVDGALSVADGGCAELQVELAAMAASDNGRTLTDAERACAQAKFEQFAAEERSLEDSDFQAVAQACFEG